MSLLRPQLLYALPRLGLPGALRWLSALLLPAVPGALLACILHCALLSPSDPHASRRPSPFLCAHTLAESAHQPPVSPAVVQALVQALEPKVALVALPLLVLQPACMALIALRARLADAPPVPPPRLLA